MDKERFIIELDKYQLALIGTLLHVFAERSQDDGFLADRTISDLAEQTNSVFRAPLKHGVGINPLSMEFSKFLYPYTEDAMAMGPLLVEAFGDFEEGLE